MAEADRDNEDDEDEDVVEEKAVMTEEVIEGTAAAEAAAEAEAEAAIGIGSGLEDEDFGLSSDDLCSWHSAADDDDVGIPVVGGSLRMWSVLT